MKFAIFTLGSPGAYDLAEVARAAGHEAAVSDFSQPGGASYVAHADVFVPRVSHKSYSEAVRLTAECAEQNPGCVLAVTSSGITHSFDKYLAAQEFAKAGISTPLTYLVEGRQDIIPLTEHLPLILKPRTQNQGKGIVVVRTQQELQVAADTLIEEYGSCIAQTFISEAAGKDLRVFVVGDKVVAAMERTAKSGSILANLSAGGSAQPATLTPEETELAIKSAQLFQSTYAGVDILRSATGPLVLEVNVSPGFKIAKITGVNVAQLIIDHLVHLKENTHD